MSLVERLATALDQLKSLGDDSTWLKAEGASLAQMQFVMWVGDHPGCRLQQIAAGLRLTAPTVSVGIQRLEQSGLLQRTSDECDQRAINLILTPRGQELYSRANDVHEKRIQELLGRLKPSEQRQLVDTLERCLNSALLEPQIRSAEPLAATQEMTATEDAIRGAATPASPKQLGLFGG
jgi:DNA-binding MarR family transcriptional regulator